LGWTLRGGAFRSIACAISKTDYFAFFQVLAVFCVCKSLSVRIIREIQASQKNRAKKPTVGFWFLEGSGNITL
jgi:hypothetical protein